VKAENVTLQTALCNPATVQNPKVLYKEVVKFVPKNVSKEVDMSEQERKSFQSVIEYMNQNMVMKENVKDMGEVVNSEGLSDMERQSYKSVIAYLYSRLGDYECTTEIEYDGGTISMPIVPVTPVKVDAITNDLKNTLYLGYQVKGGNVEVGYNRKLSKRFNVLGTTDFDKFAILGGYSFGK
jgi:hypothetical protein